MEQSSIEILCVEYDRLTSLEQNLTESRNRVMRRYFTVITAATGFIIFFLKEESFLRLRLSLVLGALLVFGVLMFLRLLALDIMFMRFINHRQKVRNHFLKINPQFKDIFTKPLTEDIKFFKKWSSMKFILKRAFMYAGPKTLVGLLNSSFGATFIVVYALSVQKVIAICLALILFMLFALLHVLYASWRYSTAIKWFRDYQQLSI